MFQKKYTKVCKEGLTFEPKYIISNKEMEKIKLQKRANT